MSSFGNDVLENVKSNSCPYDQALKRELHSILRKGTTEDLISFLEHKNPCFIRRQGYGYSHYIKAFESRKKDPIEFIKILRAYGTSWYYRDAPVLSWAVIQDHEESFDYLINEGAPFKNTLKHARWNYEIAKRLVDLEEDPNQHILWDHYGHGETIIFRSLSSSIAELLLNAGADPYRKERRFGNTALHNPRNFRLITKALEMGIHMNVENNDGASPLMNWVTDYTCDPYFQSCGLVDFALKYPELFDTAVVNSKGQTPLMMIVDKTGPITDDLSKTHFMRIRKFIDFGFDVNAKDFSGKSVFDYANNDELRDLLISLGAKTS